MSKAITVQIPANTWVNINETSGLAKATPCTVLNTGSASVYLQESAAKPKSPTEGVVLSNMASPYAEAYIPKCTDPLWVRFMVGTGSAATVVIQEA